MKTSKSSCCSHKIIGSKKGKVQKVMLFLLLILLVVIGVGGFVVSKKSTSYLEKFLKEQLHTDVKIGNVLMSPRQIDIENIQIMDPNAPQIPLLEVRKISLDYAFFTLLSKEIVFNSITINHPTAYIRLYNLNGSDNNWKKFLGNLHAPAKDKGPKFLAHKLTLNHLGAQLEHSVTGIRSVRLPEQKAIIINELDSHSPLQTEAQLAVIVAALMQALSQYPGLASFAPTTGSLLSIPLEIQTHIAAQLGAFHQQ
ncbi:MAG: AsmA family protein [Chlamydiota bacterium]